MTTREVAREQAAQWAAAHLQGRRGGSPDGRRRAGGSPGGGARGGGSPDRRGRAGGDWVDGDRGLYRRRDSPSPGRYHGHHGIQTIARDVDPDGGWTEVMRVRLEVRHMWEAV
jgi:hypothetical protein